MSDLIERLRHRDRIVHPNSRETFSLVKEAADEIERLTAACVHWKVAESLWDKDRVEQLMAANTKLKEGLKKLDACENPYDLWDKWLELREDHAFR
jgi:hypothetical protein